MDKSEPTIILVDLDSCTAHEIKGGELMECRETFKNEEIEMTKIQPGFTFFPMAEDDYFMTIAILSGKLGNEVSIMIFPQRYFCLFCSLSVLEHALQLMSHLVL